LLPSLPACTSAGLESTTKHGFLPKTTSPHAPSPLTPFLVTSLRAHARSTLAFVAAAHHLSSSYIHQTSSTSADAVLAELADLDSLYEAMTSNHVTRRGSKTQGIGMLTLWQKAFRAPPYAVMEREDEREREARKEEVMDGLRALTRDGRMVGHMPVCWGVLCGVLGLSLGESHLIFYASGSTLQPD
jgi:urease accessory protein